MGWEEKFMEGVEIAFMGNTEAASKYFGEILEQNPDNVGALLCLSVATLEKSQYEVAMRYIDRVLAINPKESLANQTKGRILAAMSKYDEAIRYYDTEIELNPDDPHTHVYRGEAFYFLEKLEQAFDCYRAAISKDPNNLKAHEKMAVTHQFLASEHLKKAEAAWKKTLDLDPMSLIANNYLSDVLEQLCKYDEAKQYRERARRLMSGI